MDKEDTVYTHTHGHTHKVMLFSFQEGNSVICNNKGEPGRHYAKWNKPNIKDKYYMILLIMWNLNNVKLTETEQWFTRGWWGGEKGEILIKEYKFSIIRWIRSGNLMYCKPTITNDNICIFEICKGSKYQGFLPHAHTKW